MSIENERLKLVPHTLRVDRHGNWIIEKSMGEAFQLPRTLQQFFTMSQEGLSLHQMAERVLRSDRGSRADGFATLARYLVFLSDAGMLADRNAIRLAESLRDDYSWKESAAFEDLVSVELARFNDGDPGSEPLRWAIGALVVTGGLLIVSRLMTQALHGFVPLADDSTAGALLVAFIFTFSVGRSARALVQALVLRVLSGYGSSLGLRLDLVSLSLATDDLSRARGSSALLLAAAGSLLWIATPVVLAPLMGLQGSVGVIGVFTCLLLLAELSPFRYSPLTEWLRAFYNLSDRIASRRQAIRPQVEQTMKSIHLGLSATWVVALALFLAIPLLNLTVSFIQSPGTTTASSFLPMAVLLLAGFIVLASFFDDIVDGVSSRWADESRRIRLLWRRRQRQQQVDEAISMGHAPSRADLEKLPLLRQIDPDDRTKLLDLSTVVSYGEGQKVCRQGDSDRVLYVLLHGRLAVARAAEGRRRKVVAFLEPGAVFGEAAYFLGQKRTADVVAVEESRVLAISHKPGMPILSGERAQEMQFRVWFLQALVSSEQFRELPSEALDALIFSGHKKIVRAGETVFSEGERADSCYFVIQGQASVVQNLTLINRVKAGDVFGEIALLKPGVLRSASVMADSDLLLVRIEAEKFWLLLCSHLPLAVELEKIAESRLDLDRQKRQAS